MDSALVLGAGGITGIAWQLGLLTGLRSAGVDLTTADLVVGTSAGSVTGTLLTAGVDLADAPLRRHGAPAEEIETLRQTAKVALVAPDEAALEALGPNVFDTSRWDAAIAAAVAQGVQVAPSVAAVWYS